MTRKDRFIKYSLVVFIMIGAGYLAAKVSGPVLLKVYVGFGIGDCKNVPILCVFTSENIVNPYIDEGYVRTLKRQDIGNVKVSVPSGISTKYEEIKRFNYRKGRKVNDRLTISGSSMFIFCKSKNFFTGLFPQLKEIGISSDLDFISRVMSGNFEHMNNLTDAFFVIMKGIFTPDLGDQKSAKIIRFSSLGKNGFISYNQTPQGNYYDCNVVDEQGIFFKLYMRDKRKKLDLDKVFAIMSTVKVTCPLR